MKQSKIAILAIIVIIPLISVILWSNENTTNLETSEDELQVYVSFYPLYETTQAVIGDKADVKILTPPNIDPHDFDPSIKVIQEMKTADLIVLNGGGFESWISNMELDSDQLLDSSNGISFLKTESVDHHEEHDEHAKEDEHDDDSHTEEFYEEVASVIEEFEHGHMTESQSIEAIEEILHEHEGDGHDHGVGAIEEIEHVLHEIEDGHIEGSEGLEEIHHLVSGEDVHDEHAKEDEHDDHDDHDDHEKGGHDGHDHDYEFDPHIWLDPILVKQQVNVIRDGLIQADPQNKEHYEENARIYNNKMDELDMKIGSALSSCQKDTIVPFHNAFTYLGERYDIHIMALSGMTPDSEASAAEIAEFVDFVKDNDIKVIFSEELVDPRLAEVIAEEANARVMLFSPLEALNPEEVGTNVSYIDKMEQNLDSLKVALECQ